MVDVHDFGLAIASIIGHVANYNITAQIEYKNRLFTKVLFTSCGDVNCYGVDVSYS